METPEASRTAAAVLDDHLAFIASDTERWLALFADDAVVEFPYATALGVTGRMEGKAAIRSYFVEALTNFDGLTLSRVTRHLLQDLDTVVAEVHGSARLTATGRPYEQDYVMVLRTRAGKIVHYREYWNPTPALKAFGGWV